MRVLLCALALFCGTVSASTGTAEAVRSLKGLKAVLVVVEDVSPEAQLNGLRKTELQTDVETQLSQAGIRVLGSGAEWLTSGQPTLYVQIFTASSGNAVAEKVLAVSETVELYQDVQLKRDGSVRVNVCTWHSAKMGVAPPSLLFIFKSYLKETVDGFVEDFLSVNPK